MFTKSQTESALDKEIVRALAKLNSLEPDSEDYGVIVDRVAKLHKLKSEDKTKLMPSPDTMLYVAANVFGVLWISASERETVLTSKALNFMIKPR